MKFVEKLVSIGGLPLSEQPPVINLDGFDGYGDRAKELFSMLELKNGFYAFESALHVFPASHSDGRITLSRWNSHGLWKYEYEGLADGKLFFAQEGFGNQFCIFQERIWCFESETAKLDLIADTVDAWADLILRDYNMQTGYPLVHEWQRRNGPLQPDYRLMPKVPFVLGGNYEIENIYPLKAVSSMRTRGSLARQIKNLPDGTKLNIWVIE